MLAGTPIMQINSLRFSVDRFEVVVNGEGFEPASCKSKGDSVLES
jgi:hypothetical protein